MTANDLPPWGRMEEWVYARIIERPIPEAFAMLDGSEPTQDQWNDWRDALAEELAQDLWPIYDRSNSKWSTPPNDSLVEADFELLKILHTELAKPIAGINKAPVDCDKEKCITHETLFKEEDGTEKPLGYDYGRYDPTLPKYVIDNFVDILWYGQYRRLGMLHYELKQKFQRPRPYQVAFIQNRIGFACVEALSGSTPSMISGHCIQGTLMGCSAFVSVQPSIDSVSVKVLKQFTMDIGDRRVFAGVHYPSDNLSSWYTALRLIPHVFEKAQVRMVTDFLWEAINTRSIVFACIKKHIQDNPNSSPYRVFVSRLEALATNSSAVARL